ncbi:MAG: ABC transporter permease [Bacteroidales bacterium]
MILPSFIAKRYLFAKKSHNVINIISLISASGIALGTMALIIILSVYNGFEGLIRSLYSTHEPDLLIVPKVGKSFVPHSQGFDLIRSSGKVASFCEIIEENIFIKYSQQESIATIKGVDSNYQAITKLRDYLVEGEFSLYQGEMPQAIVGRGIAHNLGLNIHFVDALYLYFPSRYRQISLINPTSSLNQEKVFPAGIFSIEQGFDNKYVYIPIEVARNLTEYDNEVTSVELYLKEGSDVEQLKEKFGKALGEDFIVKNRYEQNETLYKMMGSEKVSIYIILLFVIIIISCNLFGSLSMLIIDKREDVESLKSMGANDKLIKRIFLLEGWFISIIGIIVGTILGLIICFIQMKYGIVTMPGNFIIDYYPVVVKWSDVMITICGVGVIGYLAAKLPLLILKKVENF